MNKNSKQYNRSVSYKKKIAFPVNDVWKIISTPSNLELFHPFCLKNTVEKWPGENSKDSIEYYNGMILNRTFVNWIKNEGYDLFIGRKNGSLSFVSWRIKKVSDNSCTIKISVYPHKYNMGSKFFGNKNDNRETNGKRQVKNSSKNSKKNYSTKLQSKGVGKSKMTGIRKVGRGN